MRPLLKRALASVAALTILNLSAAAETILATPIAVPALSVQTSVRQGDGRIRVLLRSLGRADALHLTVEGDYVLADGMNLRLLDGAQIVLTAQDGEVWLECGGLQLSLGDCAALTRCDCETCGGLWLAESEKDAMYCGDLTVSEENGALRCVLEIDVEDYLCGVVAYEMSDSFPLEALKAQAVAARTYALRRKANAGTRDYDVTDTTADQVFKGYDAQYANVRTAVEATRSVVGIVNGDWAECYYTASNGGQIALASDVWGGEDDGGSVRKDDPFDLENPRSLVNSQTFSADLSDCAALRTLIENHLDDGTEFVRIEQIEPANPDFEGSRRFQTLRATVAIRQLADEDDPWREFAFDVSAQTVVELDVYGEIKDALNLGLNRSDCELISVQSTQDGFTLEMRRFGHGAGMSQRGAQWMAEEYGYRYAEILGFYYPGMTLERIAWEGKASSAPLPEPEEGEVYAAVALESADSALNVREKPSVGAPIVDRLANGRAVLTLGEMDEGGWIRVRTAETTGYCLRKYLVFSAD